MEQFVSFVKMAETFIISLFSFFFFCSSIWWTPSEKLQLWALRASFPGEIWTSQTLRYIVQMISQMFLLVFTPLRWHTSHSAGYLPWRSTPPGARHEPVHCEHHEGRGALQPGHLQESGSMCEEILGWWRLPPPGLTTLQNSTVSPRRAIRHHWWAFDGWRQLVRSAFWLYVLQQKALQICPLVQWHHEPSC